MRSLKPHAVLTTALFLLTGCVGAPISLSKDTLGSISRIRVVAMESPPLEVSAPPVGIGLNISGAGGPAAAVIALAGLVYMLRHPSEVGKAVAPEAAERSALRERILSGEGLWIPTDVLAEEIEKQLASAGRVVERSNRIQPMPGITDRSYTILGENWMAPMRAWYNAEQSGYDYVAHQVSRNEMILEVTMFYSVYFEDRLFVQVSLKLVDPVTGKTLGRARAYADPKVQLDAAFADGGTVFKQLFRDTGGTLVRQCLGELGLVAGS